MTNVYTCPACPLAFEVGIAGGREWDHVLFVCAACGTMHRVPVPAGRVPPDARHPVQALPGPIRSLTEKEVMVRTLREGVRTAEELLEAIQTVRDADWTAATSQVSRELAIAPGDWQVVSPAAVTGNPVMAVYDQLDHELVLDGQPCGHCGQAGKLTCWLRSRQRTHCPCCGGELVHEIFRA